MNRFVVVVVLQICSCFIYIYKLQYIFKRIKNALIRRDGARVAVCGESTFIQMNPNKLIQREVKPVFWGRQLKSHTSVSVLDCDTLTAWGTKTFFTAYWQTHAATYLYLYALWRTRYVISVSSAISSLKSFCDSALMTGLKIIFSQSVLHCLLITCYLEKWQLSTISTDKNHTLLFSLETFSKGTAFPAVQYIRIDQKPLSFPDMSSIPSLIAISCTALLCVQHGEWRRVKGRSPG